MIGKLLDHRYQVIRILATGGFGQTYIAQDTRRPGNPICVVKHLQPTNADPDLFITAKRLFQTEAETLEKLSNHHQIPRLLAYFDENQEFFLVQEFIDGHTLNEEFIPGQPWNENQVVQMLMEVLNILIFVHEQGVIHRDIKPDNLIRRASDYKLVLVDFGAVKQLRSPLVLADGHTTSTVAIGTPGYMPTEQAQGRPRPSSDIYGLGMIAIQALTGTAASKLQEDADTGEILWQHLRPINADLVAVLTKMVRYHFRERYQTAREALAACQELISLDPEIFTPIALPQAITYQSHQNHQVSENHSSENNQILISELNQRTIAVAPANPINSTSSVTVADDNKPDPLPLIVGLLLAGSTAALFNSFYPYTQNLFTAVKAVNNKNDCVALVAPNSNVRSEPSAINSDNILKTVGDASEFNVTGKRTQRGWIELKLKSNRLAWAHSDVILNNQQLVNCLRDKGIAFETINDNNLIVSRPVPSVPLKPVVVIPKPQPSPKTVEEKRTLEAARQKFESGDLSGAIAILKSIPGDATSSFQETMKTVNQWQKDWEKAEALANEINKAIDNGKWDQVLSYRDHPEKLPNIKYWRDKLEPLFKQAEENSQKPKAEKDVKGKN
ncbi:serine/threonine protein kinase [Anabaena sp. FACHB-1237]|uniref:serine/threonine-protein kinase n=1 Tax=Anabaena sp. FACHB-1237 TaxID=2692769 RepID=UPI001681383A|nr:serine/threonine-protein kinase [Anabaena sp. FACHB-1237]MBD2136641.1 serine/threonine protein kinase [Anabaena sp. FACHB-1237]